MPTQTYYTFECGPVELDLIFTAPMLMDDLEAMTAPYNYITYQARSLDGRTHEVQLYLEATPQWAVNTPDQPVTFEKIEKERVCLSEDRLCRPGSFWARRETTFASTGAISIFQPYNPRM